MAVSARWLAGNLIIISFLTSYPTAAFLIRLRVQLFNFRKSVMLRLLDAHFRFINWRTSYSNWRFPFHCVIATAILIILAANTRYLFRFNACHLLRTAGCYFLNPGKSILNYNMNSNNGRLLTVNVEILHGYRGNSIWTNCSTPIFQKATWSRSN